MAYLTRSRIVGWSVDIYENLEKLMKGPSSDPGQDIRDLIECQQKALTMGEYLESLGKDFSSCVNKLEGCCNIIYDIAENINNAEFVVVRAYEAAAKIIDFAEEIKDKLVEINKIDVFDFRYLADSKEEEKVLSKEIHRLFNDCIVELDNETEETEYEKPLVVGNY